MKVTVKKEFSMTIEDIDLDTAWMLWHFFNQSTDDGGVGTMSTWEEINEALEGTESPFFKPEEYMRFKRIEQ